MHNFFAESKLFLGSLRTFTGEIVIDYVTEAMHVIYRTFKNALRVKNPINFYYHVLRRGLFRSKVSYIALTELSSYLLINVSSIYFCL